MHKFILEDNVEYIESVNELRKRLLFCKLENINFKFEINEDTISYEDYIDILQIIDSSFKDKIPKDISNKEDLVYFLKILDLIKEITLISV